jgi:UDP-N-acetylmuramoyl-L-alanyl-D-glutamate--2,6-diaminopimelate ligase
VRLIELAAGVATVALHGELSTPVTGVEIDSRDVKPGDAFVALAGAGVDGHDFVQSAIAAGAVVVVSERRVECPAHVANLVTPDTRGALAALALNFYHDPSRELTLVGLTGTNGKTSTAYLAQRVLEAGGFPSARFGTVEHEVAGNVVAARTTTPDALELSRLLRSALDAGQTAAVAEVSSHALVGRRVDRMRIQVAAWTNLTQDHLDFHHTMDEYRDAKLRIFDLLPADGSAVLNRDDPYCDDFARAARGRAGVGVTTYGLRANADLQAVDIDASLSGTAFIAVHAGTRHSVNLRLLGAYNVHNALAALGIGFALGVSPEDACAGVESLPSVPGRFETVHAEQDFTAVVDYAHTPDALAHLLGAARDLGPGRLIVVFGCGGDRDRGKRPIMGRIGATMGDFAIITSDNPRTEDPNAIIREVHEGVPAGAHAVAIADREEAIAAAVGHACAGDMVVVAGKGHEDYQILSDRRIDFDDREVLRDCIRSHAGARS